MANLGQHRAAECSGHSRGGPTLPGARQTVCAGRARLGHCPRMLIHTVRVSCPRVAARETVAALHRRRNAGLQLRSCTTQDLPSGVYSGGQRAASMHAHTNEGEGPHLSNQGKEQASAYGCTCVVWCRCRLRTGVTRGLPERAHRQADHQCAKNQGVPGPWNEGTEQREAGTSLV